MIKSIILAVICCCICLSNSLFARCALQLENVKIKQKNEVSFIVSGFTLEEVVGKIVKEVKKPYRVKKFDIEAGTILLSKGVSLTSWGEKYPIMIKNVSDKECLVEIGFKRKYALQITGKRQYKKWVEYLKRILLK